MQHSENPYQASNSQSSDLESVTIPTSVLIIAVCDIIVVWRCLLLLGLEVEPDTVVKPLFGDPWPILAWFASLVAGAFGAFTLRQRNFAMRVAIGVFAFSPPFVASFLIRAIANYTGIAMEN